MMTHSTEPPRPLPPPVQGVPETSVRQIGRWGILDRRHSLCASYIFALVVIGLLVVAQEAVTSMMLRRQAQDAATINLAGRQRMLSQKIAKEVLAPPADRGNAWRQRVEADLGDWQQAHRRLLDTRPPQRDDAVSYHLAAVEAPMQTTARAVRSLLQADDEALRESLRRSESDFLARMDATVSAFEHEAHGRVLSLERTGAGITLALVAAVALLGAFVIRPAVRRHLTLFEQLEAAKAEIEAVVHLDSLTGVFNRRHFDAEFAREYRRCARDGSPIALIMVDIDDFKLINDHLGHPAGDDCLIRVAAALAGALLRPSDFVARYGGDEFVVCLPGTGLEGARRVADRIEDAVASLGITIPANPRRPHPLTASIGVAAADPKPADENCAELLCQADSLLYERKHEVHSQRMPL